MKADGTEQRSVHGGVEENRRPASFQKPGDTLHIYYLEGVPQTPLHPGPDFIGNRQENDSAFLFFGKPAPTLVDQLVRSQGNLFLIWHTILCKPKKPR